MLSVSPVKSLWSKSVRSRRAGRTCKTCKEIERSEEVREGDGERRLRERGGVLLATEAIFMARRCRERGVMQEREREKERERGRRKERRRERGERGRISSSRLFSRRKSFRREREGVGEREREEGEEREEDFPPLASSRDGAISVARREEREDVMGERRRQQEREKGGREREKKERRRKRETRGRGRKRGREGEKEERLGENGIMEKKKNRREIVREREDATD